MKLSLIRYKKCWEKLENFFKHTKTESYQPDQVLATMKELEILYARSWNYLGKRKRDAD